MSAIFQLILGWLTSPSGLALLTSNLPKLLDFVATLNTQVAEAKARGIGHDEAMAAVADVVVENVRRAVEAATKAEADHAAHPNDDGGFDPDVFREEKL